MGQEKHISEFNAPYSKELFGIRGNDPVYRYILENRNGTSASIISFGATLQSLRVGTSNGETLDLVAGFEDMDGYSESFELPAAPYFGATIGRFAGRISNGLMQIDQETYQLTQNDKQHCLHGGFTGMSRKIWEVVDYNPGPNPAITLSCHSPHLEDGFPGEVDVFVTYTLTDEDELFVEMRAISDRDTFVNLTHHSYFNLDGHASDIIGQLLYVNASHYLETSDEMIPTGEKKGVDGTSLDFRHGRKCPSSIDRSFVISKRYEPAAVLESLKSNLRLSVITDQPLVHVYVGGNCFGMLEGKEGAAYHSRSGICFETQGLPYMHRDERFPHNVLRKGDELQQKTIYRIENIIA